MKSVPSDALIPIGSDLERTPSGIATKRIKRGTGLRHPSMQDAVVLYWQVYDSSGRAIVSENALVDPSKDLDRVGQEAIFMMVEGEIRRFWFPDPKRSGATRVTDYEIQWISPHEK